MLMQNLNDETPIDNNGEFTGYAAVFGSEDLEGEIISQGAFDKSLGQRPAEEVRLLYQHDTHQPIGRWLEISEDDYGLYVRGQILREIERGEDVYQLVRVGILSGLSIGYQTIRSTAHPNRNSRRIGRRLVEVDLWEISLVTFPMHPAATILAKGADCAMAHAVWSLERDLKDALLL